MKSCFKFHHEVYRHTQYLRRCQAFVLLFKTNGVLCNSMEFFSKFKVQLQAARLRCILHRFKYILHILQSGRESNADFVRLQNYEQIVRLILYYLFTQRF